jgi:hypothetical protein
MTAQLETTDHMQIYDSRHLYYYIYDRNTIYEIKDNTILSATLNVKDANIINESIELLRIYIREYKDTDSTLDILKGFTAQISRKDSVIIEDNIFINEVH